jgi:hypothetical protein
MPEAGSPQIAAAKGPVSGVVPVRVGYAVADENNGLIGL